jgi:pimeloyl-ACP methyl ester carboxylesterase
MRNLAQEGYVSFISKMTQNVSSLSPNEADKIINDYPDMTEWIIIGHSLGGLTACQYAYEHDEISKVILLASYPQKIHNLSQKNIRVLSISATNDGLIRKETIISKATLLPRDTIYVDIQGGNHAQMGSYGDQHGDQKATISPSEQLEQVTGIILEFLSH